MLQRVFLARTAMALSFAVALTATCHAGEIQAGSTRQVKPNSIWFQDTGKLRQWQELKTKGDAVALKAYQDEALSVRDAWQFTAELAVQILSFEAGKNQVNVEMKTPGRLLGSAWFLDAGAILP
ncbi:MAG: hypothetical protein ABL894_06965 [Hyphomicrobium sp.]